MKFTVKNQYDGEMAVRDMSRDAQAFYDNTDPVIVLEYLDIYPCDTGEEVIAVETKLYAIGENRNTIWVQDLTFDEADEYLAELWRIGEEELNLRGEQGWLS